VVSTTRKEEGNFMHKVNYCYYCHFQTWNLCSYLRELDGLPSQGKKMVGLSEKPTFCNIILEPVTSRIVISDVDVLMYVVLTRQINTYLMGESAGTTECMML
jgi:hypothetical protein